MQKETEAGQDEKWIDYREGRMEASYNSCLPDFSFDRIKLHFHVFENNQDGVYV